MSTKTIAIGMSGGVDSSVAALLLKKKGYKVIALFMKNWEDDENHCTAKQDYDDVVRVCKQLDIPYYTLNFSKEYEKYVFSKCVSDFKKGITPNPDILCNKEIKFNFFLKKALSFGADFLATGHYVRCENNHLLKGVDNTKDQSYFLYTLKSKILKKVLFPLGNLTKKQVREIASKNNLATANKKDSTGICFIGKRKFKDFLNQFISTTPGNFENSDGTIIGQHDGISFYTIGQRQGLKIGGPGDAWYVVDKDIKRNVVIIEQGENHPRLFSNSLVALNPTWFSDSIIPNTFPYKCSCKVRYRQKDTPCTIEKIENNKVHVSFDLPQRAVTAGQSIVFYKNDLCLGGAVIKDSFK